MAPIVELRGVSKRYRDSVALEPTDLAFERGKTTALIGPSGCGKSTLLRLILRLIQPDGGLISFNGAAIAAETLQQFRQRVGYVIQDGGLFPHLTARDNMLLLARHLRREAGVNVGELCALARFERPLLDRYPSELSGGQRQRVSLMRALALSPELLLLDEPLGALDPLVRAVLQSDLKEIFHRLGQSAILVTHDLAEAAFLADSIVLMNKGRIAQRGTLRDLQSAPAEPFVTDFINAQRTLVLSDDRSGQQEVVK